MKGHFYKKLMYGMDLVMINVAFIVTLFLGFNGSISAEYKSLYMKSALGLTIILFGTFYILKVYKNLWHYISFREMCVLAIACYIGDALFILLGIIGQKMFPISIYLIYPLVLLAFLGGIRSSYRVYKRIDSIRRREKATKRVMLVGAGEAATFIIKDFEVNKGITEERIVLCVDDNLEKQGLTLNGIPIRGKIEDVAELVEEYEIDEIIIAIPSATYTRKNEIIRICKNTRRVVKIFPGIEALLNEPQQFSTIIRDVQPIDLLGREEIQFNNKKLRQILKGRTIIVTGGGGSIGSELCRQIVSFKPRLLVILDIYENNAYDLQMELLQNGIPRDIIRVVIASVRDRKRIDEVFETYKPNIVFHAAAHKHVPLMEDNPEEAIKNNVFGTFNVAQCAVAHNVSKFVLVSTDKAVNPTNVMGATKRLCEMIIQSINETTSTTDFVAVRFGNVLGSNGSVIPLFKRQLAAGGPITVTHPEIIRYFMTIPEAVRLILEATSFATGGEIFVLDMGQPVKILDLAKNFIRLSGLELDKDIKIKFTGLRPGEKLYEELLMAEEGLTKTSSDKIFVGKAGEIDFEQLSNYLEELKSVIVNKEDVRKALKSIVPTYRQLEYDTVAASK
ncbi:polysaccharide biosynthesis protein [Cellulosilyticum ruminicola]|uniref:polysaccharide biosynthesis protein n=1 Tax=Cellulosilyticum ruminicola TaxID=425254 RepID=UPI0006D19F78|nr:nucleoside-diphosphate sugar epimerase/dehydratase [Cellulosilyticum ruminicola]